MKKLSESIGKNGKKPKSLGKLMKEAGYSPSTSLSPKMIMKTKGFISLLNKSGVSDNKLAKVLADGLDANKVISAMVIANDGDGMKDAHSMTKDFIDVPDHATRHKFLTTGLILKGHMKDAEKGSDAMLNIFNFYIPVKKELPKAVDVDATA